MDALPALRKDFLLRLDPTLKQRLELAAAVSGRSMTDLVIDALEAHLPRVLKQAREAAECDEQPATV